MKLLLSLMETIKLGTEQLTVHYLVDHSLKKMLLVILPIKILKEKMKVEGKMFIIGWKRQV
jgi:hypothetical protein